MPSRRVALGVLGALAAGLLVVPAGASPLDCDQLPEPQRWQDAGTPDVGAQDMTIAAHRGAAELAPENTLDAYRYAIAYGVDMIEIDVQQTLDGRYVSFHDQTVDAKTDGTGPVAALTYDQVRGLNPADNDKWRGSVYDPAQIPSLEEIFELARGAGVGIYFDFKESVTHPAGVALMAQDYGLVEKSAFLTYEPARAAIIRAVLPEADLMISNQGFTPEMLYAMGQDYRWFGSSMPLYAPEHIAAVHDACGLAIPNVYQADVTGETEFEEVLYARSIGADGAQVNLPDVIADALDEPVPTVLAVDGGRACLANANNDMPLPHVPVSVGSQSAPTDRFGCVAVPDDFAGTIAFDGNGSATGSAITIGDALRATALSYVGDTVTGSGGRVTLAARLVDAAGAPLSGLPVTFTFEGTTYDALTNEAGVASASTRLTGKPRTSEAVATFAGTDTLASSEARAQISKR